MQENMEKSVVVGLKKEECEVREENEQEEEEMKEKEVRAGRGEGGGAVRFFWRLQLEASDFGLIAALCFMDVQLRRLPVTDHFAF